MTRRLVVCALLGLAAGTGLAWLGRPLEQRHELPKAPRATKLGADVCEGES